MKRHINIDRQGNMVIQDKDRKATHVMVDGKTYSVRRAKGDRSDR